MVVMALLESVYAATERPWHALCADPISALASENSESVGGSKSSVKRVNFRCARARHVIFATIDNKGNEKLATRGGVREPSEKA